MDRFILKQGLKYMGSDFGNIKFLGSSSELYIYPKSELETFKYLSETLRSKDEIINYLSRNDSTIKFDELIDSNLLSNYLIDRNAENSRDAAFWNLFAPREDKLSELQSKKVMLIGFGGIGNNIGNQLLRLNVRELSIVDNDEIESSNLNRQILFDKNDVGEKKVDAALKKSKSFSKTKVYVFKDKIKNKQDLENIAKEAKPDFVILSADSKPELQLYCYEVFSKNDIPFTTCGYANNILVTGPIIDSNNNKYKDVIKKFKENKGNVLKNRIIPSIYSNNAWVSSITTHDMMNYFVRRDRCKTLNKRAQIDMSSWRVEWYKFD